MIVCLNGAKNESPSSVLSPYRRSDVNESESAWTAGNQGLNFVMYDHPSCVIAHEQRAFIKRYLGTTLKTHYLTLTTNSFTIGTKITHIPRRRLNRSIFRCGYVKIKLNH